MIKKTSFLHIDWFLVAPVLVLVILSLTTLFSVNIVFFRNQLLFFILGIIIFVVISHIDYRILQENALPIYIGSLVILFLLLILGFESRGAIRWVTFFGFALQFSEILKPFLIMCFASFLTLQHTTTFKKFIIALLFTLPVAFFIYRQPDLGNAVIYLLTAICMLLFYGFPLWWFLLGLGGIAVIIPFIWRFLHEYQRQRVLTFLHMTNDPLGTSYNAIQSVIAVGSGKFLGKGLGQGTQSTLKFLPERHTDFIFATLSEMLGFIGASIVIIAFIFLLYRLFVILHSIDDQCSKVFITGGFSLLLIQFFVNIGMNMGLVPIVGVTLPFVSYGGSSFISCALLLGLVSSMSHAEKRKQVLEIR